MSLDNLYRTVLRGIATHMLRTTLTTLGILIGVASVIIVLALGNGARAAVDASFLSLGANQIHIARSYASQDGQNQAVGQNLTYQDGLEIADHIPQVDRVEMSVGVSVRVRNHQISVGVLAIGVTSDYIKEMASIMNVRPVGWDTSEMPGPEDYLSEGRFFTPEEVLNRAPVCVLDYETSLDLFLGDDPLGQTVRVDRMQCTVIGVLIELESTEPSSIARAYTTFKLIMPISTMIANIFEQEPSLTLTVFVQDEDHIDKIRSQIVDLLRSRHRIQPDDDGNYQDDFITSTRKDILGQQKKAAGTFSVLIATLALVSLFVGGIGIMNVMLVSVTERTREIGVRVAVGARRRDIISQFLLEAVLISLIGCTGGVVIGIFVIPLAESTIGSAVMLPESIPLAFSVALLTGILSGIYPAIRAANLDPIEALRYE